MEIGSWAARLHLYTWGTFSTPPEPLAAFGREVRVWWEGEREVKGRERKWQER